MHYKQALILATVLALTACAQPANIKQLQNKNQSLATQLGSAKNDINKLRANERLLKKEVDELNRVISVLGTEKSSRVSESSKLRGRIRKFLQREIDGFKNFLVKGDLLDFIGGEMVERANINENPILLVDLAHPIPRSGSLTGVGGHFTKPTTFTVKVMRKVEDELVVIWESRLIKARKGGINKINFPVAVGIERGDIIAYNFPKRASITYDTGTGKTRYLREDLKIGSKISISSLQGESQNRAYPIGVYGLLN